MPSIDNHTRFMGLQRLSKVEDIPTLTNAISCVGQPLSAVLDFDNRAAAGEIVVIHTRRDLSPKEAEDIKFTLRKELKIDARVVKKDGFIIGFEIPAKKLPHLSKHENTVVQDTNSIKR